MPGMNRESVTVALIGLTTLEALGVRYMLLDEDRVKVVTYDDFPEFSPFSESADAYVVSCDCFVRNLDFFLPRKVKTVTVGRDAMKGERLIGASSDESDISHLLSELVSSLRESDENPGDLSVREKEVLRLIAAGKINKEIADELCISVNTVISHRKNISVKLGIKSASGLSLYAMMNGLI
jgi:DNA-binding CsgD family transcriptional regulator